MDNELMSTSQEFKNEPELLANIEDPSIPVSNGAPLPGGENDGIRQNIPDNNNNDQEDRTIDGATVNYKAQSNNQPHTDQAATGNFAPNLMEVSALGIQNLPDLKLLGNASIIKLSQQNELNKSGTPQQSQLQSSQHEHIDQHEVIPESPESEIPKIPDDFYYEDSHVEKEIVDSEIPRETAQFYECFGFDTNKKYNVSILDEQHIIYSAGITYQILNIVTKDAQVFFSKDRGGIGSITVHPSKNFFAVAEKGDHPNIYVYEYPSLRLYRILRNGTESAFSSVSFSANGQTLSAVGSYSDYTISLWDWKQETIILKAKAFAQEVYSTSFSQYSENILVTSGLAHIKFWKVAETFTGLKLKGEIAKFGQVELSDIIGYFIHPDGKVLSGTEYGTLLLWEGNLIKCVLYADEETQTKCHNGCINVVMKLDNDIVTAADDGYIRFWDFNVIDNSESDDFGNFYIKPTSEILIKTDENRNARITQILVCEKYWIIVDGNGRLSQVRISENKQDYEIQTILETNSGKLNEIAVSPIANAAVTVGDDGVVRLWDYAFKKQFYERTFAALGTCVEWLPYTRKNSSARVVIVGYSNGIVRWLLLNQTGFHLLRATKVHKHGIKTIRISPDGSILAIISNTGDIFFMEQHPSDFQKIDPFCLLETKLKINSAMWDRMGEKLLLACDDGFIQEINVPKKEDCDTSETYLRDFKSKSYKIKMMEFQKPKTEEMELEFLLRRNKNDDKKEEVEWQPESIMNVAYYDYSCTKLIATVQGKYLGWIYVIDWNKDRPIDCFPIAKVPTLSMGFVDDNLLLITFKDGSWQLRHRNDLKLSLTQRAHDRDTGAVRRAVLSHDKNSLLSVGGDGTFFVYKLDQSGIQKTSRGELPMEFSFAEYENNSGINEATLAESFELSDPVEADILDDTVYSIQEAKLLDEEDFKRNEAQKKKDRVRQQIKNLVVEFERLKEQNLAFDEFARLTEAELTVDGDYNEMLHQRVEEDLEETKLELKWDAEYFKLRTKKLFEYVKDELIVDTFAVKAIKQQSAIVSTFKVSKMTEFLKQSLQEIYDVIEEEKQKQAELNAIKSIQQQGSTQLAASDLAAGSKKDDQDQLKKSAAAAAAGNSQVQQVGQTKQGAAAENSTLSVSKQEKLKIKLKEAQIRQQMEELEKKKPTKESFEPDHHRDINLAMESLGDYKLKSSPSFIVPENQRMNESKKKKHIFLLEEFVYNTKMKFNNEVISLRERKAKILEKITQYNQKILEINLQLGISETLVTPSLDKEIETPESFYDISEDQINNFAQASQRQAAGVVVVADQSAGTSKTSNQPQLPAGTTTGTTTTSKKPTTSSVAADEHKKPDITAGFKPRKGAKIQQSELEDELKLIQSMILNAEKKRMVDEMNEEIEVFDKDVENFQKEKKLIESDMCIAMMKHVTYYQELLILADMEEPDQKLIRELLACSKEKTDLEEQSGKLLADLTALANKDAQMDKELAEQMKSFKEFVYPEDDVKREKIHQYYLRKFKKQKAKALKLRNAEEDNDDFDEDEMDSEEDEDDDFMDDDDDEKPDISPVENDSKIREIIDKICDIEDQQETNRKEKQDLERQKNQISVKAQATLKELQKSEDRLRNYQREKLQKLNQLDVSFCLKVDQVKNVFRNGNQAKLPEDLRGSILFTRQEKKRINSRIYELQDEQSKIETSKKMLERRKKLLQIKINKINALIDDLSKQYNEKHMLKFGDIIDLKIIEALEPTKAVLDMREKFKEEESQSIMRVEKAKQLLQDKKNVLLQAKKENTSIISSITKLGQDLMKLSKKLDSSNKSLFKEDNDDKKNKQDLEKERQNYKDLVKFLAKEIEDLKTEIGLFKRKGGHIYTMVTSNKKTFS